jgi:hypothetical protein
MSLHPARSRFAGGGVSFNALFVGMLTLASLNPLSSAASRPVQPMTRDMARHAGTFAWSRHQIAELIDEIEAVRVLGLDPGDYGLAALRGQQVVTSDLLGATGSRQLDALADFAALSLARDYRRGHGAASPDESAPVTIADHAALRAALKAGMLRPWLKAQRRMRLPQLGRASHAQGT